MPGRPTVWMIVGQGSAVFSERAVEASVFSFVSQFSFFFLSLSGRQSDFD